MTSLPLPVLCHSFHPSTGLLIMLLRDSLKSSLSVILFVFLGFFVHVDFIVFCVLCDVL